jgi:hypothetical protein
MSRVLSSEIQAELEAPTMFPVYLFEFQDANDNWWKFTTLDVSQYYDPITYGSVGPSGTFEPLGFNFESISYNSHDVVDSASIIVDNIDQLMTSLFVGDVLQGNTAALYIGMLNPSGADIGTVKIFEGELDAFNLDEERLAFSVASLFARWNSRSNEKHSASCRWRKFKGIECQYAGSETWCDRSYKRCSDLANQPHFGGFRYLPAFENKTLWWGPTPDQLKD